MERPFTRGEVDKLMEITLITQKSKYFRGEMRADQKLQEQGICGRTETGDEAEGEGVAEEG